MALIDYSESCNYCGSGTEIDLEREGIHLVPPEGAEVICKNEECGATGQITRMSADPEDYFCQWN